MTLGTNHPRNHGREAQQITLNMLLRNRKVAYKVEPAGYCSGKARKTLWLTPCNWKGVILPFTNSVADLINIERGKWEARHPFDGRVLASGISETDVVRAAIEKIWN